MIRSLTLITLAALSGAVAAEGATSIRLGLTALPLAADYEFAVGSSGTGDWDTASRFSISAYRNLDISSPVTFNIGAGLVGSVFDQFTVDGSATATDIEMSQTGIFIEPGVVFNINKAFAVEVGVPIGVGSVVYKEKFAGGSEFDGAYVEIGLLVRPVLTLEKFQVFAEVGYLSQSSSIDDDIGNTLTFDGAGVVVSLGIGAVF